MKKTNTKPRLGMYFGKHKIAIAVYILLYLIAGVVGIFQTILFATTVEKITLGLYAQAINIGLIIIALIIGQRICWYLTNLFYNKYAVKIMAEINSDLAKQAFKLNSRTYNNHDTGTFVQRIVSDPERVVESFSELVEVITMIATAIVIVVYISILNIYVTLVLVALVIVGLLLELIRVKFRRTSWHKVRDANDKINSLTTEIVRSEKDIKSLGLEDRLSKVSSLNYDNYRKARFKHNMIDRSFHSLRCLLIDVVCVLILILAINLMDKALLTMASFMIIYSNDYRIYDLIWGVGSVASTVIDVKVSTQRMFSLFDEDEFVSEKFGDVNLEKVKGNIEFKNVNFTFKDYEYEFDKKKKKMTKTLVTENQIFNNLSFKIPHNKTVAFVGKSGSGKSTILNLISKMFEVTDGEVLIDGVNVNALNKQTLRKTFSLVNQFPYIFDMTIKENLLLAKEDATDEEIKKVIHLAYLDEFIDGLKNGINTRVGESGIKLSGGQKQRLAIARALLRNSPVILFDESTSSLDNFAQEEVKKSIDGIKGKSTVIIVAHRLSTIKDADIIFFLDGGKIVDKGTFEKLYQKNEKFRNMFLAENV